MDNLDILVVRLKERLKVYRDSPGVQVSYVDLAHMVEDILEVIELRGKLGF